MGHITADMTNTHRFLNVYEAGVFSEDDVKLILKNKMRISEMKHKVSLVAKRVNKTANWEYNLNGTIKFEVIDYTWGYNWKPMNTIDEQKDGSKRQITCYINLTQPDDYDQADLYVLKNPANCNVGLGTFFPSFTPNRVSKSTRGKRTALVVWFYGKGGRGQPTIQSHPKLEAV